MEVVRVRSVDPQKVKMLPQLPGYKSACFTSTLVAFNQIFALPPISSCHASDNGF